MNKAVLMAAAIAVMSTGVAQAEDKARVESGKVYAGVSAGMVIPNAVNFSSNTSVGGYTTNATGKFEFDNGYSVSGLAGYRFNDYLRGEAELGYSSFDYSKVSLNGTITSGGTTYTVNGTADLKGSVDTVTGMVNGIVTPMGKSKVTPLLGAGIGFAATDQKITRIGTTATNLTKSSTDLAASGMVGLEYAATEKVAVGARYRYMWVNSGGNGLDDFTAHNITATATYKF
jgi:opacity protein-like surface antigen